jgi:hypothetical protein
MVHPAAQCRRPRPRHRHSGLGWRILTCSVGGPGPDTATPALDGASSPALSEAPAPTPPLRPWMAHPHLHCRRPRPRHRHSGPGWRILTCSVGAAPAHTATPALDGASSPAVSEAPAPTPPLRPWMAHPHLQWRRCARTHRHSGPGWFILTCRGGGPGPDTATPALDGASSRALSEAPAPTPPLRPWMVHPHLQCRRPRPRHRHSGLGWRILTCSGGAAPAHTATPALDGASSRALSEALAPTPPLRPWMAHPPAQCRRCARPHRHSGLGWRILTCTVGAAPAHTATPALDGASSPAVAALRPRPQGKPANSASTWAQRCSTKLRICC